MIVTVLWIDISPSGDAQMRLCDTLYNKLKPHWIRTFADCNPRGNGSYSN